MQHLRSEIPSRGIDAERQRQPGLEQPPLAEVEALREALVAVRQLAFVNEQPRPRRTGGDLAQDPVERQHPIGDVVPERQLEDEERGRQLAGDDDLRLA